MPRAKRKTASPTFRAYAHIFRDDTRAEMLGVLGLDENCEAQRHASECAMREAATWVAAYKGSVDALDKAPRAIEYRQTLEPLGKRALALSNELLNLNQWMQDALEIRGASIEDAAHALERIADACATTLCEMPKDDSRGRPSNDALRLVVAHLQAVFNRHWQGTHEDATRSTIGGALTERENDEAEFVSLALKDAGIRHPKEIRTLLKPAARQPRKR